MFGGRGRDRDVADAAESIDFGVSSAPSSARTILPGEPFETAPAAFPSQRATDPLMPSGWGMPGLPGAGDELGATMFGAGGFGAHDGAGFPETATAPLPAMTPGGATADPLDALQQYAGLPLSGFGASAPTPDPTQLYDPSRSFPGSEAFGAAPADGAEQSYGAAPTADAAAADATQLHAATVDPTSAGPHVSAYGAPTSGFAAGGIFTGDDDFGATVSPEHALFEPAPGGIVAAVGYAAAPAPGAPIEPATDAGVGLLPAGFAAPLDAAPFGTAPVAPPVFAEPAAVVPAAVAPASLFDVPQDDDDGRGRRGHRRRSAGRRSAAEHQPADSPGLETFSSPSRTSGSRRIVAAVGVVAVLGGAGFLGYSQLAAGDADTSDVPAPVAVAPPARYMVPAALGGLTQISPTQAKAMTDRYTNLAKKALPDLPAPLVVTGFQAAGASTPGVNVVVYRASGQGEATLDALVGNLSSPGPGNASTPAIATPGGAVGGSMLCGAQRGGAPTAWCAWRSAKGVGFVRALGTDNPNYAAAYTRELRAFAER